MRLHTRASVARDVRRLGVRTGMHVIVHSSLKAVGRVVGGPVAVIQALMDVVTPAGTIVMPTQSTGYTDPAHWMNPPAPRREWPVYRRAMPAYDARYTPTSIKATGIIPETFRSFPGVMRSRHPAYSFAAWGRRARWITAGQPFADGLGRRSPLGKLYDLDGRVLLIGVWHGVSTSLHLAESLIEKWPKMTNGGPVLVRGKRRWLRWREPDGDSDRFAGLGRAFERVHPVRIGKVGDAESRLVSQRAMVDFAVPWLRRRLPRRRQRRSA